jgi:hypothetical protein
MTVQHVDLDDWQVTIMDRGGGSLPTAAAGFRCIQAICHSSHGTQTTLKRVPRYILKLKASVCGIVSLCVSCVVGGALVAFTLLGCLGKHITSTCSSAERNVP